jgi:hypothetical protein
VRDSDPVPAVGCAVVRKETRRYEEAVVGFRAYPSRTLQSAAGLTGSWLAARTLVAYSRGHRPPGRVLAEHQRAG